MIWQPTKAAGVSNRALASAGKAGKLSGRKMAKASGGKLSSRQLASASRGGAVKGTKIRPTRLARK